MTQIQSAFLWDDCCHNSSLEISSLPGLIAISSPKTSFPRLALTFGWADAAYRWRLRDVNLDRVGLQQTGRIWGWKTAGRETRRMKGKGEGFLNCEMRQDSLSLTNSIKLNTQSDLRPKSHVILINLRSYQADWDSKSVLLQKIAEMRLPSFVKTKS